MRITACLVEDVASVVSTEFDKIRWLGTWVSRIWDHAGTRATRLSEDALHDSRRATQFREMHIGISSSIYCEEEGFVIFFSPLQG